MAGAGARARHLRLRPHVTLQIELVQVVERAALATPGVQVDHARAVLDQQRARVQAALAWNATRRDSRVAANLNVLAATVVQILRLLHGAVKGCERRGSGGLNRGARGCGGGTCGCEAKGRGARPSLPGTLPRSLRVITGVLHRKTGACRPLHSAVGEGEPCGKTASRRQLSARVTHIYIGCRCAPAPDVMGRSTASVEPAPGDGAPERPNDIGANDNKAATPEKASAQGSVSGYDAPTPGSTEQISSAASAAENPRGSCRSSGSSVGPPFPKGSRREQLRRSETMRYDPDDELTCMQRMWMLLDDPSFSRGTPRLSLVAR